MKLSAVLLFVLSVEITYADAIHERTPAAQSPPDLKTVLPSKSQNFEVAYTNFWSIPGAKADVEAYRNDESHMYKVIYIHVLRSQAGDVCLLSYQSLQGFRSLL
jgi:hypothetical protein